MHFTIKKGLDIKIEGVASDEIRSCSVSTFHVKPSDFRWLKPKLLIEEKSAVEVGTPLFCSKDDERVKICSPVQGVVRAIVRGARRYVEDIVIESTPQQQHSQFMDFEETNNAQTLKALLLQNGLWPFFRQRPYSIIPSPDSQPKAIFISCFDTAPLAPDYNILLRGREEEFREGIRRLQLLTGEQCPFNLCLCETRDNTLFESVPKVNFHYFQGPHPAGNVGTQIHRIAPLDKDETVWYIHPQDVATIGRFFLTHELSFEKRIAFTGPLMSQRCYYAMPYGADLTQILQDELDNENARVVSGNLLTGLQMKDSPAARFYDTQVSSISEGGERELLGWLLPGLEKWSFSHTFLAWLFKRKNFHYDTSLRGGRRNFVMTDIYEKVFPFEILPLQLLKACLTEDFELMEELGIYEVDDEDFALCEVVCPSKMECQRIIREALHKIKSENEQ